LERLVEQADLAEAAEVPEQLKRLVEQGFFTFSTRRHYDL